MVNYKCIDPLWNSTLGDSSASGESSSRSPRGSVGPIAQSSKEIENSSAKLDLKNTKSAE